MATTSDVTTLYRGRLATGNAALLARIQALWVRAYNPLDPEGSLSLIGATVGRWTTGAQIGAAAEATRYLSALISAQSGIPLDAVRPFSVPAGLVGRVMNGSTAMRYLSQAPAVYFNRLGRGASEDMAAASTLSWLNRTAGSEPYRVANATINGNATEDDRYSGRVRRITRNDACDFCVTISDRGYIPSHADFEAHAHCRCTPEPEISSHVTSRSAIARGRAAHEEAIRQEELAVIRERQAARFRAGSGVEGIPLDGFAYEQNALLNTLGGEQMTRDALARNLGNIRPEVIDRLSGINAAYGTDNYFRENPTTVAFYRDADRSIHIRASDYAPNAIKSMQGEIDKGWWTPDGKSPSAADRTLSHELGHFLDFQLSDEQRYELLTLNLNEKYGIATVTDAADIVSQYGGKNSRELMAELWAEYKTSPNPRPPALTAGKYIEDKLGPNPSPTPSLDELRAQHLAFLDAQWKAGNKMAA